MASAGTGGENVVPARDNRMTEEYRAFWQKMQGQKSKLAVIGIDTERGNHESEYSGVVTLASPYQRFCNGCECQYRNVC